VKLFAGTAWLFAHASLDGDEGFPVIKGLNVYSTGCKDGNAGRTQADPDANEPCAP